MKTKEIWKPIKGFPMYEVSDLGHVRNAKFNRVIKTTNHHGYLNVNLRVNGQYKNVGVAKLVLESFMDVVVPSNSHDIRWEDGNPLNCSLNNLKYGRTEYREGVADSKQRRLLRIHRVKKVKSMLKDGLQQAEIARLTGLTPSMISRIKLGERCKDVQP